MRKMIVVGVLATALLSPALAYDLQTKALPKIDLREPPKGPAIELVKGGELKFAVVADKRKASRRGAVRNGWLVLKEAFLATTGREIELLDAEADRAKWQAAPAILLLGDSAAAREFGFDSDALPDQGFLVSTFPKGVAIIGNETIKVGQEPKSGEHDSRILPNAVCYAAVDFCERILDCRYYYPGEYGFYFPKVANLTLQPFAYAAAPHFNTRGNPYAFHCAMDTPEKKEKWASEMGAATGEPDIKARWRLGRTMELLGKHAPEPRGLQTAYPEQCKQIFYTSPNGRFWCDEKNYFANYYDVFRVGKGSFADILMEGWKEHYASGRKTNRGGVASLAGQEWINFGVTDVYMNPEDCIADPVVKRDGLITEEDFKRAAEVDRRALLANVYGRFYSYLCERIANELPGKKLFILAYYNCKYAPTRYKMPANFDAIVCDGSLLSYVRDPRARVKSRALFKGWYEAMGGRAPGMTYLYSCGDPIGTAVTPEYIGEAVKLLHPYLGRIGVFFDGTVDWHHFYGRYAGAHQQWDPDFDAVAAFDDMAEKMFGAAAEPMKKFHRRLRTACETYFMPTLFDRNLMYPLSELDELERLLNEAKAAVGDDELAARRLALVADCWPATFRKLREKINTRLSAEDGVYPVARRTAETVDWSKIPVVPGSEGLKLVWDERGLYGRADGAVHYRLFTDFKRPDEGGLPLDYDTMVPGFSLNFSPTFQQTVYKMIGLKPFGRLRLLGVGDDPNVDETAAPQAPLGVLDGAVTTVAHAGGRKLTLANAKASYTQLFGAIGGRGENFRTLQSAIVAPGDSGFFSYSNWLDGSVNGIPFADVQLGSANLRDFASGNKRGFEYALNFNGAKVWLRLFMSPKSPILWGELETDPASPVPITNATLRLNGIPSKLIRDRRKETMPYARQLRTNTRVISLPEDAKQAKMTFDLEVEDVFFLAQDANFDGSAEDRGVGPCLMLVDMRKVAKATTTLGKDKRDIDVSCTLKPDFGKVRFGIWEDRLHRRTNDEVFERFNHMK